MGLTKTSVLVKSSEKHSLFSLVAFLGKLNKRRNLRTKTSFILRIPGVSSMIVCVPQDFKWAATQPFEGIVSSFFTRKQDSDKTKFCLSQKREKNSVFCPVFGTGLSFFL